MLTKDRNRSLGNLLFVFALLFLIIIPIANSLVTYTATVVIAPNQIIAISDPDSARKLVEITAESGADSSAATSEDILNFLIDDDPNTGGEVIFNYAGNNKDYAQCYSVDLESSNYLKVGIRVHFSSLEVIPYEWRVFIYQPDADHINVRYYVDGSSSATGWTTIDVSSIIHQLDGQGFMKIRLISSMSNRNKGKLATVSEMEWILTK